MANLPAKPSEPCESTYRSRCVLVCLYGCFDSLRNRTVRHAFHLKPTSPPTGAAPNHHPTAAVVNVRGIRHGRGPGSGLLGRAALRSADALGARRRARRLGIAGGFGGTGRMCGWQMGKTKLQSESRHRPWVKARNAVNSLKHQSIPLTGLLEALAEAWLSKQLG